VGAEAAVLPADFLRFTLHSLSDRPGRSLLTGLGIAVGIAAVVLLTSIGEGLQRFVLGAFTQFGTDLIAVTPGKTTTHGMSGAMISNVRPLSLDDAQALGRLRGVEAVVPVLQGNAAVEAGSLSRRTMVLGVGPRVPQVWSMRIALGRFLPDEDPRTARAFAVLGSKAARELFGDASPLGERVRIGGESYRVLGVMEPKGQFLGFDLDDTVYLPVARAMAMFNRASLMEVDLLHHPGIASGAVAARIKALLEARHGDEDFTITTQDQMLEVLGNILGILTLAVGALGSISLLVGGVGILTIMTIAVSERRAEIGLLRALGASRRQVLALFVGEAVVLSALGGGLGIALGAGGAWLLGLLLPALPTHTPWSYALLALVLSAAIGLLAGALPAYRASRLDPVASLRAE
jgi:putative ABC transport system permease protein